MLLLYWLIGSQVCRIIENNTIFCINYPSHWTIFHRMIKNVSVISKYNKSLPASFAFFICGKDESWQPLGLIEFLYLITNCMNLINTRNKWISLRTTVPRLSNAAMNNNLKHILKSLPRFTITFGQDSPPFTCMTNCYVMQDTL